MKQITFKIQLYIGFTDKRLPEVLRSPSQSILGFCHHLKVSPQFPYCLMVVTVYAQIFYPRQFI